jgi:hypothetical protein
MKKKPNKPLKNCASIILILIALIFTANTGTDLYIKHDNLVGSLLLAIFVAAVIAIFVIDQFIEE